jgi:YHS domain-containing protein
MTTRQLLTALMMALAVGAPQSAQEKPTEALDGTDPVLLVQGKDTLGKPAFRVAHEGFEYLFASAETKAEFEKNPSKYAVQLGGLCARMGKTASGNMSDYLVHDGKIYVFGSDDCHKAFAAAPAKYLAPKPDPVPSTPEALARGRSLVDRAAAALGGQRLDSMTSLVESSSQTLRRMDAEVPVQLKTTWRFPDAVRVERQMTRGDRTMSNAVLLTRDGAWYQSQGQSYPMIRAARSYVAVEHGRQLVALLRARRDKAFVAAALGRASGDGMDLERVRIRHGDLDVVLGLDPASARPRSLAFTDRNDVGTFGRYVLVYDDYRTADGLTLPFAVKGSYNGQPDAAQSWTVASVQVNGPIETALFQVAPAR